MINKQLLIQNKNKHLLLCSRSGAVRCRNCGGARVWRSAWWRLSAPEEGRQNNNTPKGTPFSSCSRQRAFASVCVCIRTQCMPTLLTVRRRFETIEWECEGERALWLREVETIHRDRDAMNKAQNCKRCSAWQLIGWASIGIRKKNEWWIALHRAEENFLRESQRAIKMMDSSCSLLKREICSN